MNKNLNNKMVKSQQCIAPLQFTTQKIVRRDNQKILMKQSNTLIPVQSPKNFSTIEEDGTLAIQPIYKGIKQQKSFECLTVNNVSRIEFHYTSIIGRRDANEDTELISDTRDYQLACVFDGHNGDKVSRFCAQKFSKLFAKQYDCMRRQQKTNTHSRKPSATLQKIQSQQVISTVQQLNMRTNSRLSDYQEQGEELLELEIKIEPINIDFEQLVKNVLDELDQEVINNWAFYEQGSTATIFVYAKQQKRIIVANIGDSKTLLGLQNRFFQSLDHKPSRQSEQERIKRHYPKSYFSESHGIVRLNGNLSLTRSIGDQYMRQFGLSSVPEIYKFKFSFKDEPQAQYDLSDDSVQDMSEHYSYKMIKKMTQQLHYVLLACDGLFDIFTPENVDDIVRTLMKEEITNNNNTNQQLLDAALLLYKGQTDDSYNIIRSTFQSQQYTQNQTFLKHSLNQDRQIFEQVDQEESMQKKITQVLTQMAFLCGCSDNITVLLGIIEDY